MTALKMKCDHCGYGCKKLHLYNIIEKNKLEAEIRLCTKCQVDHILILAEIILKTHDHYKRKFLAKFKETKPNKLKFSLKEIM